MPADNPPRWITIIKVPYNYEFSRTSVACYREPGEYMVKAEVADHAVANGYAIDGRSAKSTARSIKSGPPAKKRAPAKKATAAARSATAAGDAATDKRSDDGMAGTHVPAADRADVRSAVDQAPE